MSRQVIRQGGDWAILFLAAFVCAALALLQTGCSGGCSFTTAKVVDPVLTTDVDVDGKPVDRVTAFRVDSPQMAVSAQLRHAPENTKLRFVWTYLTQNIEIKAVEATNADRGTDVYVFSTLNNGVNPWPVGDYRVSIFVDAREKPDATVDFKVE